MSTQADIDRMTSRLRDIFWDVREERANQLRKWGVQSHEPLYWAGILGEEVGEVHKGCIELGIKSSIADVRAELVQVAAVCAA